jgi:hypothetical protein
MDPDETMTTSSTSSPSALPDNIDPNDTYEEDDNLFPTDTITSTTQNAGGQASLNGHLNNTAPGELSPPRSQPSDSQYVNGSTAGQANVGAHRVTRSMASDLHSQPTAAQSGGGTANATGAIVEQDDRPGAGWRSKRAQDEMQRAWENIVDRDFSTKEYGDIMMLGREAMGQSQ